MVIEQADRTTGTHAGGPTLDIADVVALAGWTALERIHISGVVVCRPRPA